MNAHTQKRSFRLARLQVRNWLSSSLFAVIIEFVLRAAAATARCSTLLLCSSLLLPYKCKIIPFSFGDTELLASSSSSAVAAVYVHCFGLSSTPTPPRRRQRRIHSPPLTIIMYTMKIYSCTRQRPPTTYLETKHPWQGECY